MEIFKIYVHTKDDIFEWNKDFDGENWDENDY
jgi:hypothetical protein